MSTIFRILWELLFLVLHPKGPIMSIVAACRYLRESEGWANSVIKQYKRFGHVDFSEERGPKRVITKARNLSMVKLATVSKPKTTSKIAETFTAKGTPVSGWTVARQLKENHVRWNTLPKKKLLS